MVSDPCEPSCTLRVAEDGDRLKLGSSGGVIMLDGELLHATLNTKKAATASVARNRATSRERRILMAF